MRKFRAVVCGLAALSLSGIAAANNDASHDDGFVWIDANTRIKVKPISTVKPAPAEAGSGASAPEKAAPKKRERKEKPAK